MLVYDIIGQEVKKYMRQSNVINLKKNENYYYISKRVLLLNIFEKVHLVKIRILDTNKEIIIDSSAISITPLHESTISVKILGGGLNDFRFL